MRRTILPLLVAILTGGAGLPMLISPPPAEGASKCFGKKATITGTNGNDKIDGTNRNDVIVTLGGNDLVEPGRGDDRVCLGDGKDTAKFTGSGDSGDDRLFGGDGNDVLRDAAGKDELVGDEGDDVLNSLFAADELDGGEGDDFLQAAQGADVASGGLGNDDVEGGQGPDEVTGGDGDDRLDGDGVSVGNGADEVFGGDGDDRVVGGGEDDDLFGDAGDDDLRGQNGDDDLDGGADTDVCDQGGGTGTATGCESVAQQRTPDKSRSQAGAELLRDARFAIQNAEDSAKSSGAAYDNSIREASKNLRTFITRAFDGYEYFDGCNTRVLVENLLEVAANVDRGYFVQGPDRAGALGEARSAARGVVIHTEGCAPGFESRADDVLTRVRRLIGEHEDGKVGNQAGQRGYANLRTRVLNDGRNLITSSPDQVAGGCEVPGFYRNLETYIGWATNGVMTTREFLLEFKPPKSPKLGQVAERAAEQIRRQAAQEAEAPVTRMIREWKKCSPADCADKQDNDGDGTVDASDHGCFDRFSGEPDVEDRSEEASEVPGQLCPPAGSSATPQNPAGTFLINLNSGEKLSSWSVFDADTGEVLVWRFAEEFGFASGSAELGGSVCGPGTFASVKWTVEGTRVTADITVVKEDEAVASQPRRIVLAGNTR